MASAPARSPRPAALAAASSWSVTLAMALTTTTGCSPCATPPATISAVRWMAVGVFNRGAAELHHDEIVMRNRLWIEFARAGLTRSKLAQCLQHLRIQQRSARRAANGVVREHGELPVQRPQGRSRPTVAAMPSAAHAVQPRLRDDLRLA